MSNLGIHISLASSKKVVLDGKLLFSALVGMLGEAQQAISTGLPLNVSSIASSVLKLFESITVEESIEGQLTQLIIKSYQKTFQDVVKKYENYLEIPASEWEHEDTFNEIEAKFTFLQKEDFVVGHKFFHQFYESDIVNIIAIAFMDILKVFCNVPITPGMISFFKYQFLINISSEFVGNKTRYIEIEKYCSSVFANSMICVGDWVTYRSSLINAMKKNVEYDNFSLEDIYIQLCGYYYSNNRAIIVRTEEWLLEWVYDLTNENNIMLVTGNPASGKTTLLKKIAYELSLANQKVIWIPLKNFSFTSILSVDIELYCTKKIGHNPFQALRSDEMIVILIDGLDEIALRGEKSLEKAQQFIDYLRRDYAERTNIRIIVSGRKLVVRDNANLFVGHDGKHYVLDMLPMYISPDDVDLYAAGCELMVDQRNEWWQKYGIIRGKDYIKIPDEIMKINCSPASFDVITGEPFLSYLLAVSYENKLLDFEDELSINDLYRYFVTNIYKKTWSTRSGLSAFISEEKFLQFLEIVGTCSWHSDKMQFPISLVEQRCEANGYKDVLEGLCSDKDVRESITGLMLLFYFDESSSIDRERSFEFSHKSFGEYFAGVYAARVIMDTFATDWHFESATKILLAVFGFRPLDEYVYSFFFEELKISSKLCSAEKDSIQRNLSIYFPKLLSEKIPLKDVCVFSDDKTIYRAVRNLETAIFIALCAMGYVTGNRQKIKFLRADDFVKFINKEAEFKLIEALGADGVDYSKRIGQLILEEFCSGIYLAGFLITECVFISVGFDYGVFLFAIINKCRFNKCDFGTSNFSYALIRDTRFEKCDFRDSIFYKTTFFDVTFVNCKFSGNLTSSDGYQIISTTDRG